MKSNDDRNTDIGTPAIDKIFILMFIYFIPDAYAAGTTDSPLPSSVGTSKYSASLNSRTDCSKHERLSTHPQRPPERSEMPREVPMAITWRAGVDERMSQAITRNKIRESRLALSHSASKILLKHEPNMCCVNDDGNDSLYVRAMTGVI